MRRQLLGIFLAAGLLAPTGSRAASWWETALVIGGLVTGSGLTDYGARGIRTRLESVKRENGQFTNTAGLATDLLMSTGVVIVGFMCTGWATARLMRELSQGVQWITSAYKPVTDIKTRFIDVGGAQAAKQELMEIVHYLKDPGSYAKLGAHPLHGVLLWGDPGNGKTLLARALAGEAGVPFFSVKGSEFTELYIGVGSLRVRQLFETARKCAPCIIFFDEFDSLAGKRVEGMGSADRELSNTLNQLLAELDGFAQNEKPIIVLAATNRPDMLDSAATRPGRFDKKIEVPFPDLVGRTEILTAHVRKIAAGSDIDIAVLARGTPGFSGAKLEALVNEAARCTVIRRADMVAMCDFDAARDTIIMGGRDTTRQQTPELLRTIAYHEAGHALVTLLLPEVTDPLYKVTIEPRGSALGFAASLPKGDYSGYSRDELIARIMIALGGRIGEELGTGKQFTGVSSDLRHATDIANDMVRKYGMSELGLIACVDAKNAEIDRAVHKIIKTCEDKTRALLTENRGKLETLALELFAKGTLTSADIYALLGIAPR